VVKRNSFALVKAAPMDGVEACNEGTSSINESLDKGRPPP
jgi:hypothetical protein